LSRVGSVALNSLSILRAVERDNPELARNLFVAPIPQGPGGRLAPAHVVHTYVIWRFATNPEAAQRFLADLAAGYQEAFEASGFYNFPSFPGAVFDLERLLSDDPASNPSDKLIVLADAESWSTNAGHPGHTNAAVEEVLNGFIIPQMFARAARGEMSPPEAVRWAEEQISPIYGKWREAGKV
ncbi:MAG: carbohydrate ABC transporter substrate-binding protein, partial [Acidimicrobiia bacterium]